MRRARFVRCTLSAILLLAAPLAGQEPIHHDAELPSAVFDSSGGTVVVWVGEGEAGRGIFVRRGDAAGAPLGPPFRADPGTASGVSRPSLVPLPGGGFAVAWNAPDGSGSDLWLRPQDAEVDGFWRSRIVYLDSPYVPLSGLYPLAIQDDEVSPAPGVFRLEAGSRQVEETAGHAEVRVRRFNGMGGTVSVRWTVVARSATPVTTILPISSAGDRS